MSEPCKHTWDLVLGSKEKSHVAHPPDWRFCKICAEVQVRHHGCDWCVERPGRVGGIWTEPTDDHLRREWGEVKKRGDELAGMREEDQATINHLRREWGEVKKRGDEFRDTLVSVRKILGARTYETVTECTLRATTERDEARGEADSLRQQVKALADIYHDDANTIASLRVELEDALSGIGVEAGRRRLHEDEIGRLRAAAAIKDEALRDLVEIHDRDNSTNPALAANDWWREQAISNARAALSPTISSTQADSSACPVIAVWRDERYCANCDSRVIEDECDCGSRGVAVDIFFLSCAITARDVSDQHPVSPETKLSRDMEGEDNA